MPDTPAEGSRDRHYHHPAPPNPEWSIRAAPGRKREQRDSLRTLTVDSVLSCTFMGMTYSMVKQRPISSPEGEQGDTCHTGTDWKDGETFRREHKLG